MSAEAAETSDFGPCCAFRGARVSSRHPFDFENIRPFPERAMVIRVGSSHRSSCDVTGP